MAAGDNASSPELLPFVALLRDESALFTDWSSRIKPLQKHVVSNGKVTLDGSIIPAVIFFDFLLRLVIVTIGGCRKGAILNDTHDKRVDPSAIACFAGEFSSTCSANAEREKSKQTSSGCINNMRAKLWNRV